MHIYCLTNTINGKKYVGQTSGDVLRRVRNHFASRHAPSKTGMALHAAIAKYGREAFEVTVLETCDSQEALDAAEARWIAELNTICPSGYNMTEGGRRVPRSGIEKAARRNRGRPRSEETRRRCSLSQIGKVVPEHTREKQRAAAYRRNLDPAKRAPGGERAGHAKFTSEQVKQIRERIASGEISQKALARELGVNQSIISELVRRVTYRDVP